MIGRVATAIAGLVGLLSLLVAIVVIPEGTRDGYATVRGELAECDRGYCIGDRPVAFDLSPVDTTPPEGTANPARDDRRAILDEALRSMVGRDVAVEVDGATAVVTLNGRPIDSIVEDRRLTSTVPAEVATTEESDTPDPRGVLTICGDGYCVGTTSVYFGPWWYVHHGASPVDLNGDGLVQTPATELSTFLGTEVVVTTASGSESAVVRTFEGAVWTAPGSELPWSGGPVFEDGPPDNAGEEDGDGPPDHAGEEDGDGPPDHAGEEDGDGPPDHAGEEDGDGPPPGVGGG